MKQSDTITSVMAALFKVQKSVKSIVKTASAQEGDDFWTFAPLADVIAKVQPAFSRNGLLLIQDTAGDGKSAGAMTRIVHVETGEWIQSEWLMLPVRTVHDGGTAITYARRYSLLGLLGIAPRDVDGVSPTKPTTPAAVAEAKPGPPTGQEVGSSSPQTGADQPATAPNPPRWMIEKIRKRGKGLGLSEDEATTLVDRVTKGRTKDLTKIDREGALLLIAYLDDQWAKHQAERAEARAKKEGAR